MSEGVRLNKYVADCTGLSRRRADTLIDAGQVFVNGKPGVLGQSISPEKDRIHYQGQRLYPQKKRYIAFHKPKGVITTREDPMGRKTIYDVLPEAYSDLDPVGRLDRESTGLLLLSNDGQFVQKLAHPRFEHDKVYRVRVNKALTEAVLETLSKGVYFEPEGKLAISTIREVVDPKNLVLSTKTGLNRQIRRSFEALGYEVVALKRVSFAGIVLGDLSPGKTRALKPTEIKMLMTPKASNSSGLSKKQRR